MFTTTYAGTASLLPESGTAACRSPDLFSTSSCERQFGVRRLNLRGRRSKIVRDPPQEVVPMTSRSGLFSLSLLLFGLLSPSAPFAAPASDGKLPLTTKNED